MFFSIMHIVLGIVPLLHTLFREQMIPVHTVGNMCILNTYSTLFVWNTYLPGTSINSTRGHFNYPGWF